MRLVALPLVLAALLAGCGGASSGHTDEEPQTAHLNDVTVGATSVRFQFDRAPGDVRARYEREPAECGSGRQVRLRGSASAVVHFTPALSARIDGEKVVPTYTGPTRLPGPGPVLEVVKSCDFESDLGWAIGVERRLELHVSRDGSSVTVSFG